MKQSFLGVLLVGASLVMTPAAFANADKSDDKPYSREEFKKLTPEQREKFHEERKAKWDALSKDEKLKVVNERHEKMRKHMDEKWSSLSDDEKLEFAEKRMKKGTGKHRGGPDGDHAPKGDDRPAPGDER